jgi:adenylate cyclase|tara:strand:- start:675 stop:2708 length:2034 start_codon:yes stop_codon:yes gene_type:complete
MKYILSPIFAIITTLLLTWLTLSNPTLLQVIDLKIADQLIVQEKETIADVVLIDISEKTLEVHGQYPLPRDIYGDLIVRLREANAGVIVFNISFPEEDRTGMDEMFTSVLGQGVILSHFPSNKAQNRSAYSTAIVQVGNNALDYIYNYPGIAANLEKYENVATGIGIANTLPEIDGVVRRLPMLAGVGDDLYPSIVLEIFKAYSGSNTFQVKSNDFGVTAVRVKGFPTIKTDPQSRIWMNPNYDFKRYDLVKELPDLNGATVFIGVTAEGVSNPVPTASGAVYGHDVTARSFASVKNRYNIITHPLEEFTKLIGILVLGLAIVILSYIRFGWVISISMTGALIYLPVYFFNTHMQLYITSVQGLMGIIVFAHVYGVKYGQEYFEKMKIKKQFAGYTSPEVVLMLQNNPEIVKNGIKKEVSIVFSDLRGFTPLGESFGDDVKGLTQVMNSYMDAISEPVIDANGMIIKYIGDASMHIHNAPMDDPDHPKTAVQTGLNMLKAVDKFNEDLMSQGKPEIGMGAGINSGLGYIGEMGSTKRHAYDILGDAVSTAARIESKCKEYGCLLLVGGDTYKHTRNDFFYLKVDDLAVKGKTVGIEIYTVLDIKLDKYPGAKHLHEDMHVHYRKQNFDKAIEACNDLMECFDGQMKGYYSMWIERCEFQKTQTLPKDWDGVFIATSK